MMSNFDNFGNDDMMFNHGGKMPSQGFSKTKVMKSSNIGGGP